MSSLSEPILAAVLGIVEGLTEFIPVSSTGHLILFGEALEFHGPLADTFDVFIQLGAILAVVVLYFRRFTGLLDLKSAAGFAGRQGIIKLGLATFPALVAGLLLHKVIKEQLFSPVPVACALIVGGIGMILVERFRGKEPKISSLDSVSYRDAFVVGLWQVLALWPGMSRSGSTMMGAMLLGLNRTVAAELSFLMAVPVMCAAVGYDMFKHRALFGAGDLVIFAIGFVVSFVVAIFAIKFFLRLLRSLTLVPFAVYRIVLGAACLFLQL